MKPSLMGLGCSLRTAHHGLFERGKQTEQLFLLRPGSFPIGETDEPGCLVHQLILAVIREQDRIAVEARRLLFVPRFNVVPYFAHLGLHTFARHRLSLPIARYIQSGEFGLWEETGRMNDAARAGARDGLGLGEALGRAILDGPFPHKDISVLAAGARLGVPVTVHVGVGHDIIHEHPNCDGAALGQTSYQDFLIFAQTVTQLEGGVLFNFGTAVMGPEVYLKALAMARNVAHQAGGRIARFTTAVFDLIPLGDDYHTQAPKTDPRYYYRPWKTILVRTVADGGESFYVQGDHRQTLPRLYHEAIQAGG